MYTPLYNVARENQLTEILSEYNTEFVMSVIDKALESRYNPMTVLSQPNVVASWEQNFKQYLEYFEEGDAKQRIIQVRNETYKEIIERICKEYDLDFTIEDELDWYSVAYYLYDFFVSNFNVNIVQFFSNLIYRERASIYESMGLSEMRRNKDSSTIYTKKVYSDMRLAIINANIKMVIDRLLGMDYDFRTILAHVYFNPEQVNMIGSLVSPRGNFFEYFRSVMRSPIEPIMLTEIRFAIQNLGIGSASEESGESDGN